MGRTSVTAVVRLSVLLVLAACGPDPAPEAGPLDAPPIDSARIGSVDEMAAWAYQRGLRADLDGDGSEERIVIAADVEEGPDGRPLWEDGHRWAVFVESAGERTLLYGAFVPNGFAEAALLEASDGDGRRGVLIHERTPARMRAYDLEYLGPHSARLRSVAYYRIDAWLPGSAHLASTPTTGQ